MSKSKLQNGAPSNVTPYRAMQQGGFGVPSQKKNGMEVTHDGSLPISTGASRKELYWKNTEMLWSELLDKLSGTVRTHETQAEYTKAPKSRKDEIKDVGGFVGGTLTGGRRKAGSVLERSMLTLDADFSTGDLWENFTLMYGCSACVYSTHSHTPEKPRLRLIIPLLRTVDRDEYEAVARKVAGAVGIDDFDDTTYQAERLMYWPSTSKDAEFVFEMQDGEWLDPDEVLAEYSEWKDASQCPVSSRVSHVVTREIKKQEDPTEKKGVIGAFCRSYDIHEAIEKFLPDHYEKCDTDGNRYTYLTGSTAGGLVTYDDKWAFSHHGTDPASGKLCNAFDLVRIHLFGLMDEDAKPGTPASKLPSFQKMQNLAASDELVRLQIGRERLQSAREDFADCTEDPAEIDDKELECAKNLKIDKAGNPLQSIDNSLLILSDDPPIAGAKLAHNDFAQTLDVRGPLPWNKPRSEQGKWSDYDYTELLAYMEKKWGITSERVIKVALKNVFSRQRYHPVVDHLKTLKWDGKNRLETLLIDYLGAEDNAYTRAVTRKALTAAVARVFRPGCKFDYVLVIIGAQGIGKSMLVQALGYADHEDRNWSSDNFSLSGRGDKRDIEQLLGVWIMEIPELAALYGKNSDAIKSFISTRQDEARLAYREEKGYFPRQCIFIGTTNNMDFLSDSTGNRRFWPVVTGKQKLTKNVKNDLPAEVDQIWAEAVENYKKGEALYLDDPKLEAFANAMQEQHRERDSWEDTIADFLETPVRPDYWENPVFTTDFATDTADWVLRDKVTVEQIFRYALGEFKTVNTVDAKRIRKIMRGFENWEDYSTRIKGRQVRIFRRIAATKSAAKRDDEAVACEKSAVAATKAKNKCS